jgi:hypothetical protein
MQLFFNNNSKFFQNFFKNDSSFDDFVPFRYFEVCTNFDGCDYFIDYCYKFTQNITKIFFTTVFFQAIIKHAQNVRPKKFSRNFASRMISSDSISRVKIHNLVNKFVSTKN